MTWMTTARPGDHRISTTDKWRNVFHSNESVVLSLTAGAATLYEVRNFYGTVVTSGSIASGATDITLGTMPLGWYKIYYIRTSTLGNPYNLSGGEDSFVVVRPPYSGLLAARPAYGTGRVDTTGDRWFAGHDLPARCFTGMGPSRITCHYDDMPTSINYAAFDVDYWNDFYVEDTARPQTRAWISMDNSYGYVDDSGKNATINTIVDTLYPKGTTMYEGFNEPNNFGVTKENMVIQQGLFAAAVHAANASALAMGPCTIAVNETQSTWMRYVLANAASSIDVISFHNYTGGAGDLPNMRRTLDSFLADITAAGVTAKPRFNSESGSRFMAVYGSFEPRLQAQDVMLEYMMFEQYGVPKEHMCYFYDWSHGFWDFPSFWILNEGGEPHVGPLMALMRTYSEELAGKQYAARLDFGTVENNHFVGSRFTNPTTGVGVVAMMSGGRQGATVTLSIGGAAPPASVTVVGPWGDEAAVDVVAGIVTVNVGLLPTYVRLPSGNTAAPEVVDYGIEVIRAQQALATASSQRPDDVQEGIHTIYTPMQAIDGRADNSRDGRTSANWNDPPYMGDEDSLPAWWQVDFPRPTRFDTVVIQTPPPWQHYCALIDFDVQYWDGDEWIVIDTITEPTNVLKWATPQAMGACFSDSYYSRCSVFVVTMDAAVSTTKMRLYVRETTYGSGATADVETGFGVAGGSCGQCSPQKISLVEVSLFLSGQTDGGNAVAGQKMLVIPAPGA